MTNVYTTMQGDTWDIIAYKTLGSEYLLPLLLDVNQDYRNIYIFDGDVNLVIPNIDTDIYTVRPNWIND